MQVLDTSSRLPFPGRVGLGALPWSQPERCPEPLLHPPSSQPCGSLLPAFPPAGRAAEALTLPGGLRALQKFVPPKAFSPLLAKVLPPHFQKFWFGCWVHGGRCVYRLHAGGLPCFTSLDSLVSRKIEGVDQVFRKSWIDSWIDFFWMAFRLTP